MKTVCDMSNTQLQPVKPPWMTCTDRYLIVSVVIQTPELICILFFYTWMIVLGVQIEICQIILNIFQR